MRNGYGHFTNGGPYKKSVLKKNGLWHRTPIHRLRNAEASGRLARIICFFSFFFSFCFVGETCKWLRAAMVKHGD